MDDKEIEGLEFFLLALEDLQWGEIIGTTSITIIDDDSKCGACLISCCFCFLSFIIIFCFIGS